MRTLSSSTRRRTSRLVLGLPIVLGLLAAGEGRTEAPSAAAAETVHASDSLYRLQAGDVLNISVWKEDSLDKQVLVRPDGGLSFPLAGDLMAAGLTPAELEQKIEHRLAKFLSAPTVTVSVMQVNGSQIYVVGKVNRPGAYKFDRQLDVLQALSLAGGMTEFAATDDVKIIRRRLDGGEQVFEFEYSQVARGRHLDENIVLQSGDTLVVP